ncbi:hypothetical protein SLEP1_g51722 [Rubroshorea leprosula]|uniref:HMA domain-containing protein n=1 Tax=Rubroshorea leprosula TaxID=152421 RepID=A0AAV5M515_9ROSI|nr:hypothetical protein SLEP1_g51722 [Rubroshorea leprosula]
MPKKIVIEVPINCDKCRTKALKIAAGTDGLNSVAIQGADKLVVIGDGIDSVALTCALRKKLRSANILSVQEEKAQAPADPPPPKKTDPPTEIIPPICYCYPSTCQELVVCDPNPNPCSIM